MPTYSSLHSRYEAFDRSSCTSTKRECDVARFLGPALRRAAPRPAALAMSYACSLLDTTRYASYTYLQLHLTTQGEKSRCKTRLARGKVKIPYSFLFTLALLTFYIILYFIYYNSITMIFVVATASRYLPTF